MVVSSVVVPPWPPVIRLPIELRCMLIRPVSGAVMRLNSRLSWAERIAAWAWSRVASAARCSCTR